MVDSSTAISYIGRIEKRVYPSFKLRKTQKNNQKVKKDDKKC